LNEDFLDLLRELQAAGAEFIVVGAHALAANGIPRATVDLDVLVRPSASNADRVFAALRAFGAPLATHGVHSVDFAREGTVYQMGLPPRRIDITTRIDGVTFDEAIAGRVVEEVAELRVPFVGLRALARSKSAAGRPKDRADLELMREAGIDVDALLGGS
jgi:hypothetical protein